MARGHHQCMCYKAAELHIIANSLRVLVVINHHFMSLPNCRYVVTAKPHFPFVINHHFINVSECHKSWRGLVVVDLRLSVSSFVRSKLHCGGKIITAFRTRQPASPNSYPISSDPVVMANLQHSSYPSIHTFSGIQTARLVELRIQIVNCIHDVPSQRGMYAFWVQVLFLPAQQ